MAVYNEEEIVGYYIDEKVVCKDCVEEGELNELTEDMLILERDTEGDKLYFCDRCGKRL